MTTPGWRAGWRTPTRSSNGANCVEVDFTATGVQMRDSKARGAGPILDFTPTQWAAFVRESVHDLPSTNSAVAVTHQPEGTQVQSAAGQAVLHFTRGEWAAFVAGARDGEFDYHAQVAALIG
ncbi:MAG TPA: DUF397 domain-containing protein [Pseudonocardiaceae bacterium]|jgi:hypothetical protein|nr:DUF397 domain-containing protein [Pseudonocardiaceae bacterium]